MTVNEIAFCLTTHLKNNYWLCTTCKYYVKCCASEACKYAINALEYCKKHYGDYFTNNITDTVIHCMRCYLPEDTVETCKNCNLYGMEGCSDYSYKRAIEAVGYYWLDIYYNKQKEEDNE